MRSTTTTPSRHLFALAALTIALIAAATLLAPQRASAEDKTWVPLNVGIWGDVSAFGFLDERLVAPLSVSVFYGSEDALFGVQAGGMYQEIHDWFVGAQVGAVNSVERKARG